MKDFKEAIAKPRKVAIYASLTITEFYSLDEVRLVNYDEHYDPLPEGQTREIPRESYVRITEPVDVTFRPVDNDTVVRNAVESLDEEERKAIRDLNKKVANIRERKAQLLALAYRPEPVS